MIDYDSLVGRAIEAQGHSYAPYSSFNVGAALLTKSGNAYTGCNVENASFGATICAERVAFSSAICAGECDFAAIAIVGGMESEITDFALPCGICLQFMSEFCDKDFEIVLYKDDEIAIYKLGELLPNGFKL